MKADLEYIKDIAGSVRFEHMLKQMAASLEHARPALRKGEATRAAIVVRALQIAGIEGIEHVTFGSVAEQMKIARSRVFSHFGSRDKLLLAILDLVEKQFRENVFTPALNMPRGLPRLEDMFFRWAHSCAGRKGNDCLLLSAPMVGWAEPGPVRDKLAGMVLAWQEALRECIAHAIDAGHLRADTDAGQLSYELYGIVLALHQQARFLGIAESSRHAEKAFRRLVRLYEVE